ncbi:hypothetical protein WR25_04170 isoform E [Diploscapter pachys]|uniref:Uncharacterized protein n=1 Tax=Diploscapter pachys TaxID=2018661 RepID=A0A2A2LGD1_9BILA|nr:hypothetical protein WR25_04170 isoform A [Diploscapter pachys]PAV85197.1 hypothetical protein WR25_04170 isoform B [Diploscapter pachys]PAV85198.1 hypothetical protein WR25_04170 isoform C [Diploscapter pachys]PAV85199.1 hypothetical protein WR25_04170 isoform D [Diploscapter pachys]PAV85200.1 hypothetical protein WR25_04170 isoform E [Diploscapter pachys]
MREFRSDMSNDSGTEKQQREGKSEDRRADGNVIGSERGEEAAMQQPQAEAGLLFQNLVYSVVNKSPQCPLYLLCWLDLAHFLSLTIPCLALSSISNFFPPSLFQQLPWRLSFLLLFGSSLFSSPSAASHSVEHSIRSALSELLLIATNYD